MSSAEGVGLLFRWRELDEEIAAIAAMASSFLDSETPLAALRKDMERIARSRAEADQMLELQPLRTQSTRDYETKTKSGGTSIYALVTGKWRMRSIGHHRQKRKIAFTGLASAVIELWPSECLYSEERQHDCRLARWRIELGADDSPGCYFHAQVLGDRADNPFPRWLPIPRLPSPFATPMAVVEFVLGELFQDRWRHEAARDHGLYPRWRTIQRARWVGLLRWQEKQVMDLGRSSPWMNLKAAKPPDDLFLSS